MSRKLLAQRDDSLSTTLLICAELPSPFADFHAAVAAVAERQLCVADPSPYTSVYMCLYTCLMRVLYIGATTASLVKCNSHATTHASHTLMHRWVMSRT